jgi:hypothetical protein
VKAIDSIFPIRFVTAQIYPQQALQSVHPCGPIGLSSRKLSGGSTTKITVYGNNTYADTWFKKSGLKNAAAAVSDSAEVSMEQIYQWNPDLIYVCFLCRSA